MELIIDTSSKIMTLLLNNNGRLCSGENFTGHHAEHLLSQVEILLEKCDKKLEDIDVVSPVIGPGSFTGIRLAVSTVKALSYVYKDIKIVPIDRLDFLEWLFSIRYKGDHIIAIPCTKTKSYVLENIDGVVNKVTLENHSIDNQSNNIPIYGLEAEEYNFENLKVNPMTISENDYLSYVKYLLDNGKTVTSRSLEPIYMALSQAEEEFNGKNSR